MNYLAEILAFNNWTEFNSNINKSDICLWYALMHMANRFGWQEFNAPMSVLILKSKLNRDAIYRSRNKLKQLGLIEFKERGNQAATYEMLSIAKRYGQNAIASATTIATSNTTSNATTSANIPQTKNQKPKTKNKESIANAIPKKKLGEFKNVLMAEQDFKKLKTRFGSDCERYIERLSNYLESSGKRYKSHYATILNWAEKDTQNNGTGGSNYGNNRGYSSKQICNEYPE